MEKKGIKGNMEKKYTEGGKTWKRKGSVQKGKERINDESNK